MGIGGNVQMGLGGLLGFGLETIWGTIANITEYMEFDSASLKKTIEEEKLESIGAGRGYLKRVVKNISVEASITYNLHPVDGINLLKQAFMGTVTSALSSTNDAYAHTFNVGDLKNIDQKGITMELRPSSETKTAYTLIGARINSWKLSFAANAPVKCELGIIAKDMTLSTCDTIGAMTFSTVSPLMFDGVTIQMNGVTEDIISGDVGVENNLQTDDNARSLGSNRLTVLPPGKRNVSLNLVQRYDTTVAYDRFQKATEMSITMALTTGETIGSIDSPGTSYSIDLNFPKVYYNTGGPPEAGIGILTHNLEVSPILNTATGYEIVASVYNSSTSYA